MNKGEDVAHAETEAEAADNMEVIQGVLWLMVLSSRAYYQALDRKPDPAHLIRLIDIYISYAARDGRYHQPMFQPVPYERRVSLAVRLRALLEDWTPPDLPEEVTTAARELLHAEGLQWLNKDWETFTTNTVDPENLLWPEGIPWLLQHRNAKRSS